MPEWQSTLLTRHGLGENYLATARKWFIPVARAIAKHQSGAGRPILIGVNGSQGSGKTTLTDFLCCCLEADFGLTSARLSLDDVYLTRADRAELGTRIHPLLATRGVPGTHDMTLLLDTLKALLDPAHAVGSRLPAFDKSIDDRSPLSDWVEVATAPSVILLEGWCMGATPQSPALLAEPINNLEREEDAQGVWRSYVNDCLTQQFPPVYALVDQWLMLQAPSFDCVFRWRQEQEKKLALSRGGMTDEMMDDAELVRFVAHFERLTRHCLSTLPDRVDHLLVMDERRAIIAAHIEAPA